MSLHLIFTIGAVIFAVSSVYFWFADNRSAFSSSFLVTAITTVSYLVMLDGGLSAQMSNGAVIHWTRWAGYALSCPLLFYVVASGVKSVPRRVSLSSVMALVMITGAFSAVWSGWIFWFGFGFSTLLFAIILIALYERSDNQKLLPMQKYIWFGWVIFPVVFLLGPSGLYVLSAGVVAVIYLLLDLFTKIYFYVEVKDRDLEPDGWWSQVKRSVS